MSDCKAITIVNGWGAHSCVWDDFTEYLGARYQVNIIDLPRGQTTLGDAFELDDLVAELDKRIVDKTHLVGWSLGGNVAVKFADQHCEKVASLLTVATNPKFVQGDGWVNGMPRSTFDDFYQSVQKEELKALKLFAGLQAVSDSKEKTVLRALRQQIGEKEQLDKQVLAAGLNILGNIDQRHLWSQLTCPVRRVFGEKDNLVPADLAKCIPSSVVMCGVSHAPMLSEPAQLAELLEEFIG